MDKRTTVMDEGEEKVFSDPVTAVADIYGVDRHDLATAVVRLQVCRLDGIVPDDLLQAVAHATGAEVVTVEEWLETLKNLAQT